MEIGVMGATGPAGTGIAARLASIGHDVIAGSRELARAKGAVTELQDRWGDRVATLRGDTNAEAASALDLVVLATTWHGAVETAHEHRKALAGKVVIAMANGIEKIGREFRVVLPEHGSLAEAVQAAAPDARVVSAFHLVPASAFAALDRELESDVVVCGDDDAARTSVLELVAAVPSLRAFDSGSLANSLGIEAFSAVLLTVNLRHKGKGTLRLSGVEGYSARSE